MQDPGSIPNIHSQGRLTFHKTGKKIKDIYIFSIVYNLIISINVGDEYN